MNFSPQLPNYTALIAALTKPAIIGMNAGIIEVIHKIEITHILYFATTKTN